MSPLVTVLLAAACVPVVVVAGRDLRLNWNAPDPEPMQAWAHGRARSAGVFFAITAPPLHTVSPVMGAVFWGLAVLFVFVLVPNRVLSDPPTKKRARKRAKKTTERGGGAAR